jgi:peroxiredoxin (alkyl hydroperoxide reductase subunit C)
MEEVKVVSMPRIGDPAPSFEAQTTMGPIKFPDDFKGQWVVLFSHPADFTPVCTTEFIGIC